MPPWPVKGIALLFFMMHSNSRETDKVQQAEGGFKDAFKIKCILKKGSSTRRQYERVWRLFIHWPI
jgi:hypothetical protein